ncbi:hypothetical protein G6011_03482 [Alternaria panax]|uniref:Uncharacterized protein n=1 Tax=Alternaria panax TaxID=48097 RepID=A0AAD4NSW6_9PLEO|nr:hypothetical protein G6011_03482 [Alternaria panax]
MAGGTNSGAVATGSLTWDTATFSLPTPSPTNREFPVPLYSNKAAFTTVFVQYPLAEGVRYEKDLFCTPGQIVTADETLTLQFITEPIPSILFHFGQSKDRTNINTALSPSTTGGASVSSNSPQNLATRTASDPAASPTASESNLPSANSGTGLSTGAIAGIAIGCIAAGVLIAGLVLWVCRRRRSTPKTQYSHTNTYATSSNEKGFSANAIPLVAQRSSTFTSGGVLPQPLEDKAISDDVSKISNAIKNHVQSYYHSSRVNPGIIDHDDLQALGSNLPISAESLTTLMANAATREIALRFIIAWVIVSKIQPSRDPSKSLLPSEVADCYQAVANGDGGYQAQASLTARWRVMTAELMQSSYARNPFSPSDSRHASIQATLATLDNVLQPYADTRMDNGERKRNLEEVLKRAALFAFTLFSQPSAWKFEWQEEQGVTPGDLCIFPALVQVADEAGQPVSPPRPFSEAVTRRLDA